MPVPVPVRVSTRRWYNTLLGRYTVRIRATIEEWEGRRGFYFPGRKIRREGYCPVDVGVGVVRSAESERSGQVESSRVDAEAEA